jgi:hypothetical protein
MKGWPSSRCIQYHDSLGSLKFRLILLLGRHTLELKLLQHDNSVQSTGLAPQDAASCLLQGLTIIWRQIEASCEARLKTELVSQPDNQNLPPQLHS